MSTNVAKKSIAIQQLAAGASNQQAAETAGVTPRTIQRWLKEPQFQQEVTQLQDEAFATLARRFVMATGLALQTAVDTLKDPKARRSEKMRAAEYVTKYAATFRDQLELAQRIAVLEEKLRNV